MQEQDSVIQVSQYQIILLVIYLIDTMAERNHSFIRSFIGKHDLNVHIDRNLLVLLFGGDVVDELLRLPKYLNALFYEQRKFYHE